ncbi:hypothetical protein BVRB_013540 [Beta vulgaris subsp. vulgaris]|uniref:TF-B3 domain-containing protein n=2 Tax=Beta vulgaris subsp. vulgaris TaxID=3555 RepID=A0A0J8B1W5_BETVV|nr:hypothetical protein BVRB_013540 [Beta vulgaris subsp. vulgaris]
MNILNDIHDESVKQGVGLPPNFRLYYKNPRTKQRVELYKDVQMSNMWGGFAGKDAIEIFIEETNQPLRFVFKFVLELREQAEKEREEERRRQEEEEKILRELENQEPPLAIEIPVYSVDDLSVMEWYRVYSEEEVVMGESEPQPDATQPEYPPSSPRSSPVTQPPQPPSSPLPSSATQPPRPPSKKRRDKMAPSFYKKMGVCSTQDDKIRIPAKYVKRYYEKQFAKDYVNLRAADGRVWRVELLKVSGTLWLSKGWEVFLESYSIEYGYLVLFSYKEIEDEFHVNIYDKTCCEIVHEFAFENHTDKAEEVVGFSSEHEDIDRDDDDDDDDDDDCIVPYSEEGPNGSTKEFEEFESLNPHFKSIVRRWSLTSWGLTIPLQYAREHLDGKNREKIILEGPGKMRYYNVNVNVYLRNCVKEKALISGSVMRKFFTDNELKLGDCCVFELIHPQSNTYKATIFRAP